MVNKSERTSVSYWLRVGFPGGRWFLRASPSTHWDYLNWHLIAFNRKLTRPICSQDQCPDSRWANSRFHLAFWLFWSVCLWRCPQLGLQIFIGTRRILCKYHLFAVRQAL
ncbi:hypothetical protein TNCT_107631 [Trichonephila clavata]|uniref:Uncharacterized protein n=1 Tax=Trichonephila clavata TaxID=2740835 RepID=A0A8X6IFW8_TRICU|nr:hypothetical protein TNCT_107631 [Trichonephila clavata]